MRSRGLLANSVANYVGQVYVVLVSLFSAPIYLKYLGPSAFGLVGIYALFQAFAGLLDLGLTPTVAREFGRRFPPTLEAWALLRSAEVFAAVAGALVAVLTVLFSDVAVSHWLKEGQLDRPQLVDALLYMGLAFSLQWVVGIYRGASIGLQDQVWLNAANMTVASVRLLAGFLLLAYAGGSVVDFFRLQVLLAALEVAVFRYRIYAHGSNETVDFRAAVGAVKRSGLFAISAGYSSALWVLTTQTDKLTLSTILPLDKFAYLTLVTIASGAVLLTVQPIVQALFPRLVEAASRQSDGDVATLYRSGTQAITVVAFSAAAVLSTYGQQVLFVWTGDMAAAAWGGPVLVWFALASGLVAVSMLQFVLQQAAGTLKLHIVGASFSAFAQVPILFLAALHYGASGAGVAVLVFRLAWFLVWTPIVHRRFLPYSHRTWVTKDVLPICTAIAVISFLLHSFPTMSSHRAWLGAELLVRGLLVLLCGLAASPACRFFIFSRTAHAH